MWFDAVLVRELVQTCLDVRSLTNLSAVNKLWHTWLANHQTWIHRVMQMAITSSHITRKNVMLSSIPFIVKAYTAPSTEDDRAPPPGRWKQQCRLAWQLAVLTSFDIWTVNTYFYPREQLYVCKGQPSDILVYNDIKQVHIYEDPGCKSLIAQVCVKHDGTYTCINMKSGQVTLLSDRPLRLVHVLYSLFGWEPCAFPLTPMIDLMFEDGDDDDDDDHNDDHDYADRIICCNLCDTRFLPLDTCRRVDVKCKRCEQSFCIEHVCSNHTAGTLKACPRGWRKECDQERKRIQAKREAILATKRERERLCSEFARKRKRDRRQWDEFVDNLTDGNSLHILPEPDWKRRRTNICF